MINVKSFGSYIEDAMNGNEDVLKEYKYKSSKEFVELLNSSIEVLDKEYFKIQAIKFKGEEIVSIKEIEELFTVYYKDMPLFRRSEKIKRILISKIKDKRDEEVYKLNAELKEKINNLSKDESKMEKSNIEYLKRIKIREIVREVINSRNELDAWIKAETIIDLYKKIVKIKAIKEDTETLNNVDNRILRTVLSAHNEINEVLKEQADNLGYMDLVGILYLRVKLQGLKVREEIKHIVIDEAQDYSFLQFEIIKEMTGCKSYTIVGDSNQRLITTSKEPAMLHLDEVFKDSNIEIKKYELNKSYRSTQEIMEYANEFLKEDKIVPLVRRGEPVIEEEISSNDDFINTLISIIEDYEEDGHENIAVIFKGKKELNKFAHLIKEKISIQNLDNEDILYKGGKVLIPAYLAKGLEFDGVIIVENKEIQPLVKYIMCTRALHRLSIIKDLI